MAAVRPFVAGTGCSGMTHSLTFADKKLERDTEVAPYLIIDPVANQFMDGATIDYDTSGMSPTFIFSDVFRVVLGCVEVAEVQDIDYGYTRCYKSNELYP